MIRLTTDDVIFLHKQLIEKFGGKDGIRDYSLLDSAVNAPFATFGGEYLIYGRRHKAACLAFGLLENNAFLDGNKRIAAHSSVLYLAANGLELEYEQDEMAKFFIDVANGKGIEEDIYVWFVNHTKSRVENRKSNLF